MNRHTPGPWKVIERLSDLQSGTDVYVGLPDRRDEIGDYSLEYAETHVARVFDGGYSREANARLIAAAPDMLDIISKLVENNDSLMQYVKIYLQSHNRDLGIMIAVANVIQDKKGGNVARLRSDHSA